MRNTRTGVLAAVVLAVGGGVAVATAGISVTQDTESIAPNTVGTATAKCPRGGEVVAQGFKAKDFDADYGNPGTRTVFPNASRRAGSKRAKASGLNLGTDPARLATYAYCAKPKPGLSVVRSERVAVPNTTVGVAKARCPRGSEAVGGGSRTLNFSPASGPRVYTAGSRRTGNRTWKVTGAEINGADGGAIVAFAYCDETGPGLTARSARADASPVYGTRTSVKAKCRRGDAVLSGGFEVDEFDPTYTVGPALYPIVSKRAGGRGWKAVGHNDDGDDTGGEFVAYAYCKG